VGKLDEKSAQSSNNTSTMDTEILYAYEISRHGARAPYRDLQT